MLFDERGRVGAGGAPHCLELSRDSSAVRAVLGELAAHNLDDGPVPALFAEERDAHAPGTEASE